MKLANDGVEGKALNRALNGIDILIEAVRDGLPGVSKVTSLATLTVALAHFYKMHGVPESEWKRIVGGAYATAEEMQISRGSKGD